MTPCRFDLRALHDALDQGRASGGLTWTQVARQVGVSSATVRRTSRGGRMEVDGVRAMVAWLGRAPEEFMTAAPGSAVPAPKKTGPVAPGTRRRFDARALFAALDRERGARQMRWSEVARQLGHGVAPGMLTRLRGGGRVEVGLVAAACGWLSVSVEDLTHVTDR